MDANFRLKQKERGFHSSGTLGPGWGYFVDPIAFMGELRRVANLPQISEVRAIKINKHSLLIKFYRKVHATLRSPR